MKVRFDPTPDPKPDPKIDNIIIAHRGKPVLGKFYAAYCEEKYKLWTKAIFPTRIMW